MIEVYYAEDDEMIGKSVKEYLEQQNCKVSVFDRIADAKKALIGHLPTIVLLDWNMPDGQGNELCLWIRERWKTNRCKPAGVPNSPDSDGKQGKNDHQKPVIRASLGSQRELCK